MATVEQIQVTIIAVDGSTISYRDTVTGARGRANRRGFAFETDSQYTIEVDTDSAAVLAIHGAGSAAAHDGGRRLASWRKLKLSKPSVVSPRTVWVSLRTLGPFISELDRDDRHRFGIDR